MKGFTDPDFIDYKAESLVACFAEGTTFKAIDIFDKAFKKAVKKYKFEYTLCEDIFPPTRRWTEETQLDYLSKIGKDAMMYFQWDYQDRRNGAFWESEVTLIDADTKRVVWVGRITLDIKGWALTGSKNAAIIVKLALDDLKSKNHL